MAVSKSMRSLFDTTIPTGTALDIDDKTPTLFTPIKIRGLELQNRFVVSPMGTWSAQDGHLTDFHLAHFGSYAIRGAALTVIESTAVAANGRTTPLDSGLWKESHIPPLRRVVDFIHNQGQKAGIQLNHAGCKASMIAPKLAPGGEPTQATEQDGGWPNDVWAPCAIPYTEAHITPRVLSIEQIESLIQDFGSAARRAVQAGIDFIEIHGAHGYLIHQFLSPLTNQRTDEYGGSFDNRVRFLLRVIQAIRAELPESMPLSVRISATEWMEWSGKPCWDLDQSIRLAKLLPEMGVDILDVSSGGNHKEQKITIHPNYQINLANAIRGAIKGHGTQLYIGAVGFITNAAIAMRVVQSVGVGYPGGVSSVGINGQSIWPEADLAFIGRQFLREPEFVLKCADELRIRVQWPYQYQMARTKDD